MKSFEYAAPESIEEAASLLATQWGEAEILAGGTDLVTCLKQRLLHPKRLVSLRHLKDLRGIESSGNSLTVGATTTLKELAAHDTVRQHFPSLIAATEAISSPQMLAVGTVGGDLCQRPRCWYYRNGFGLLGQLNGESLIPDGQNRYHAVFGNSGPAYFVHPSSLAPALIALGATCKITGPRDASRSVPAASFFQTPKAANERETTLKPNEILTAIEIPVNGARNATYEIRHRHGLDWPYVTASVAFQLDGATASSARVVLGHVAPVPWNAEAAAKALDGARITADLAARCGQEAAQGANPLSQNAYKVQLVKTAVKRAVLQAAGIKTEA